jgi:hypothetical protein
VAPRRAAERVGRVEIYACRFWGAQISAKVDITEPLLNWRGAGKPAPSLTLPTLDGHLQVFVKRPAELVFCRRDQYLLELQGVPAYLLLGIRGFVLQ